MFKCIFMYFCRVLYFNDYDLKGCYFQNSTIELVSWRNKNLKNSTKFGNYKLGMSYK